MDGAWHHIAIAVQEMDRELKFYCDLLGFEVDWKRPNYREKEFSNVVGLQDADTHVVMLKGYGTRIELFKYHNPKGYGMWIEASMRFRSNPFYAIG